MKKHILIKQGDSRRGNLLHTKNRATVGGCSRRWTTVLRVLCPKIRGLAAVSTTPLTSCFSTSTAISRWQWYSYMIVHGRPRDFFPGVGKFIGVARIFSKGALFSWKKLTTFFSRRPQNTGQNYTKTVTVRHSEGPPLRRSWTRVHE